VHSYTETFDTITPACYRDIENNENNENEQEYRYVQLLVDRYPYANCTDICIRKGTCGRVYDMCIGDNGMCVYELYIIEHTDPLPTTIVTWQSSEQCVWRQLYYHMQRVLQDTTATTMTTHDLQFISECGALLRFVCL
jgi:hypothetical protein